MPAFQVAMCCTSQGLLAASCTGYARAYTLTAGSCMVHPATCMELKHAAACHAHPARLVSMVPTIIDSALTGYRPFLTAGISEAHLDPTSGELLPSNSVSSVGFHAGALHGCQEVAQAAVQKARKHCSLCCFAVRSYAAPPPAWSPGGSVTPAHAQHVALALCTPSLAHARTLLSSSSVSPVLIHCHA